MPHRFLSIFLCSRFCTSLCTQTSTCCFLLYEIYSYSALTAAVLCVVETNLCWNSYLSRSSDRASLICCVRNAAAIFVPAYAYSLPPAVDSAARIGFLFTPHPCAASPTHSPPYPTSASACLEGLNMGIFGMLSLQGCPPPPPFPTLPRQRGS